MDLNKLLSQRMNEALHKSLDIAISRFEDGDITGIMVCFFNVNVKLYPPLHIVRSSHRNQIHVILGLLLNIFLYAKKIVLFISRLWKV